MNVTKFYNANHSPQRDYNPFEKVASIYDRQSISNRGEEEKQLRISSLPPMDEESILSKMATDAKLLDDTEIDKQATVLTNPFDAFGHAKHYIASKLGVQDELAHDLASSVLGKAEELRNAHGGEINEMVTGIVDHMDKGEIESRTGVAPMRSSSPQELEEMIEDVLTKEFQLTSYQAETHKKIIIQQARNLSTIHRNVTLEQLCVAILAILEQHGDISIAPSISTSNRLKDEIAQQLLHV